MVMGDKMEKKKRAGYEIGAILHEMREEYWQGLAAVEENQGERLECVSFLLGGELYAFETTSAAEVIRIPRLVKVPRVQELIVGVFNLRGEITAAIDIRPLLGLPTLPIATSGRIVVVKGEKFNTGLLVESVRGVESFSLEGFEPVVQSLSGIQREFIRGQIRLAEQLVVLLDVVKLMKAPEIMVEQQ
jgi:purine-binding chemotaxis protein CheW